MSRPAPKRPRKPPRPRLCQVELIPAGPWSQTMIWTDGTLRRIGILGGEWIEIPARIAQGSD